MTDDIAIKVEHVSKTFKLPHEKQSSIKGALISKFKGGKRTYEKQEVLKDVSFEIKKGEFFGIVGRNGSGKSTLLKMLAGIYTPTNGSVQVNGKLTPFIELGVGFNPELTGRENVYLNGALLGFNRKEMADMYEEIVSFAELEKFMDQKLKNYSSGMQVRLAFSIATRVSSEILIFDEVLAVGDSKFQKKCLEVFRKLKSEGKTIVLVSHSTADIERFCDRVLVVDKSKSLGVMDAGEAIATYEKLNIDGQKVDSEKRWGTQDVTISGVSLRSNGKDTAIINLFDQLTVRVNLQKKSANEDMPIVIGIGIHDAENDSIIGPNTATENYTFEKGKTDMSVEYEIPTVMFNPGSYSVTAAVFNENSDTTYDHIVNITKFDVLDKQVRYGKITLPDATWKVLR
jgi:ABC-2 type transport system ATP-binding protein